MPDTPLADEVKAFVRDCVETFEQLEILLLVHQRRGEVWTAAGVSTELRLGLAMAADALDHLRRRNILVVHVGTEGLLFRYAPGSPSLDQSVGLLVQSYRDRRIEVITLLSANAVERVRTSAIRMFADAFLIGADKGRKGKNDG